MKKIALSDNAAWYTCIYYVQVLGAMCRSSVEIVCIFCILDVSFFFFFFYILFPDDVRPSRITQTENYTVWKAIPSQMLYPSNLDLCRRLFPFWMTHANSIDYRRAAARNVSLMARRYINCPLYYLSCRTQYNILCYYLHKLCRVHWNNRHGDENNEIDTLYRYIHNILKVIVSSKHMSICFHKVKLQNAAKSYRLNRRKSLN